MIQIPKGNEFQIYVPIIVAAADGVKLTMADLLNISSVQVEDKYGNTAEVREITTSNSYVVLSFAGDVALGTYDVAISGLYDDRAIAFNIVDCFSVTQSGDSRWGMFTPLVAPTQIAIGEGVTEEEVRKIKADLADLDEQLLKFAANNETLANTANILEREVKERLRMAVGDLEDLHPDLVTCNDTYKKLNSEHDALNKQQDGYFTANMDRMDGQINATAKYAELIQSLYWVIEGNQFDTLKSQQETIADIQTRLVDGVEYTTADAGTAAAAEIAKEIGLNDLQDEES